MRCFSVSSVHAISMAEANQSVYFVQLTAVQTAAGFLLNILVDCLCAGMLCASVTVNQCASVSASYTNGCCRLLSHLPDLHFGLPANRKKEGLIWRWLWPTFECLIRLKWWWSFILTVVTNRIMVLMLSWCLWWHSLHLQKYISSDDQDAFHFV